VNLVTDGTPTGASHAACQEGLAVVRVGQVGDVPGATKLVQIRFAGPADHDGTLQHPAGVLA
jgi:hypothetical protein